MFKRKRDYLICLFIVLVITNKKGINIKVETKPYKIKFYRH